MNHMDSCKWAGIPERAPAPAENCGLLLGICGGRPSPILHIQTCSRLQMLGEGRSVWNTSFLVRVLLMNQTKLSLQMKGTSVQSWVGQGKVRADESSLSTKCPSPVELTEVLKAKRGITTLKCGLLYNYRCILSFKDIYIPTSHIVDRTDSDCVAISNALNSLRYHWEICKALLWLFSGQSYETIVLYPRSRSRLWFSMYSLYFCYQCIDCLALIIFPAAQEIYPPNWILLFPLLG